MSFDLYLLLDHTLRLWDLNAGTTTRRFVGHTKDVLSVSFSADNRQIVSGSRDRSIKLWNTVGVCKFTLDEGKHTDWVSSVRVSPNVNHPIIVSGGWDKQVKLWNMNNCKIKANLSKHDGYINCVAVAPDASLCASGGKDKQVHVWDPIDAKYKYSLNAGDIVHALAFSPEKYWLCAATKTHIKIWDLTKREVIEELDSRPKDEAASLKSIPICISLTWSADNNVLYAGYTDNTVKIWAVNNFPV